MRKFEEEMTKRLETESIGAAVHLEEASGVDSTGVICCACEATGNAEDEGWKNLVGIGHPELWWCPKCAAYDF